jgi:2-polyprenyl-6-methoxyphenol hydroxylase-like FAD-dependent oxidoreductase
MDVPGAGAGALDVLIAGAGPTGLTAGCLLARRGLSVGIVRKHRPLASHSRATGLWPRALGILDSIGVAGELEALGSRIVRFGYYSSGEPIGLFEMNCLVGSDHRFLLGISQHQTEAALEAAFVAAGGIVVDGEVTELEQDDRQVTVGVRTEGSRSEISAPYLIGADGANSAVRGLLGITMNDVGPTLAYRIADAVISGLPENEGNYCWTPLGGMGVVPHDRSAYRLAYRLTDSSPDVSLESFQRLLNARGPRSHQGTIKEVISTADFETRYAMAERFRVDRCFLAGDAAHLMSPTGAQGMNSGILDAAALALGLEQALGNSGTDDRLAAYDAERQSTARDVMAIVMQHARDGSLKTDPEIADRDRRYLEMSADPALHLGWVTRLSQLHIDTHWSK